MSRLRTNLEITGNATVDGNTTIVGDLTVDDITADDISADDLTVDDISAGDITAATITTTGAASFGGGITDLSEPSKEIRIIEDWLGNVTGAYGWNKIASGTNANTFVDSAQEDLNHHGILFLQTGTTNTGFANQNLGGLTSVGTYTSGVRVNGGSLVLEAEVYIPVLATVSQDYAFIVGVASDVSLSDAIAFRYYRGTLGTTWFGSCITSSVESTLDSAVTVAANNWYKLGIVVNALGTSVEFFINGISVGTISSNIPVNVSLAPVVEIDKIAGTTNTYVYIDYYKLYKRYTNSK